LLPLLCSSFSRGPDHDARRELDCREVRPEPLPRLAAFLPPDRDVFVRFFVAVLVPPLDPRLELDRFAVDFRVGFSSFGSSSGSSDPSSAPRRDEALSFTRPLSEDVRS
jgi:hypothetical protein